MSIEIAAHNGVIFAEKLRIASEITCPWTYGAVEDICQSYEVFRTIERLTGSTARCRAHAVVECIHQGMRRVHSEKFQVIFGVSAFDLWDEWAFMAHSSLSLGDDR